MSESNVNHPPEICHCGDSSNKCMIFRSNFQATRQLSMATPSVCLEINTPAIWTILRNLPKQLAHRKQWSWWSPGSSSLTQQDVSSLLHAAATARNPSHINETPAAWKCEVAIPRWAPATYTHTRTHTHTHTPLRQVTSGDTGGEMWLQAPDALKNLFIDEMNDIIPTVCVFSLSRCPVEAQY